MTYRKQPDSYVYVIGSREGGPVKIGTTTAVARRLSELQTGNPRKLEVLLTLPGDRVLEQRLHEVFADRRVNGEWFDFGSLSAVKMVTAAARGRSAPSQPVSVARTASPPKPVAKKVKPMPWRPYLLAKTERWGLPPFLGVCTAVHWRHQVVDSLGEVAVRVEHATALEVLAGAAVLLAARTLAGDARRAARALRAWAAKDRLRMAEAGSSGRLEQRPVSVARAPRSAADFGPFDSISIAAASAADLRAAELAGVKPSPALAEVLARVQDRRPPDDAVIRS